MEEIEPRKPYGLGVRFSVDYPFFTYPDRKPMPKSALSNGQAYADPEPYFQKTLGKETKETEVAVFGVVDPNSGILLASSTESRTLLLKADPVELSEQDRRVWFVSHSSSVALTAANNSISEADRRANFSGIASTSQLQAKAGHELILGLKDRIGLLGRRADYHMQPELNYDSIVTAQTTSPALLNVKQNLAAGELGLFLHQSRDYPRLGLLASIRDETQLCRPRENVTLSDNAKSSLSFEHNRTNTAFGHFGFRAQNRHSSRRAPRPENITGWDGFIL